ncbi:MAG: hypothetical protein JRI25_03735 [Deltaproteobacteria bacterium]|nr:hypothetical protein [Deltaproteobacteria bacterium]
MLTSDYVVSMELKQCQGVVLQGRTAKGGRSGLIPPRRCRRAAFGEGDYCEVHQRQAEVQDLLHECLKYDWERIIERWESRREREQRRAALAARSSW